MKDNPKAKAVEKMATPRPHTPDSGPFHAAINKFRKHVHNRMKRGLPPPTMDNKGKIVYSEK